MHNTSNKRGICLPFHPGYTKYIHLGAYSRMLVAIIFRTERLTIYMTKLLLITWTTFLLANFDSLDKNDTELRVNKKSGFEMVVVQGGIFIMGGNDNEHTGQGADECPHKVSISDFSIGKYEVTQADWIEIMGSNPSHFQNCNDCPVEQVSWDDVKIFIQRVNNKYRETYRLPTEDEWEFAARGGIKSKSYKFSGSNKVEEVAWYSTNSNGKSHSVGLLKSNELGLYDMSGNIWEWCSDWKIPYPCDVEGKSFANVSKVLRGGTFANDSSSVRVRDRNGRGTSLRLNTLGFRLAK
jgi:sulfatase modifying factor 1